ncbi:hypothetical protein FS837_005542 [Tulasnella sp. UAMH 9824]|nr:hypothetical protein FS837_005542 [Tulasnella sp. UAMH 9824]
MPRPTLTAESRGSSSTYQLPIQQDALDAVQGIQDRSGAQLKVAVIGRSMLLVILRSGRKDCVKQHVKRRHPDLAEHQVLTLPPRMGSSSGSSSDDGFGLDPVPSSDSLPLAPSIVQPQPDFTNLWQYQSTTYYYMEAPPQTWPAYE